MEDPILTPPPRYQPHPFHDDGHTPALSVSMTAAGKSKRSVLSSITSVWAPSSASLRPKLSDVKECGVIVRTRRIRCETWTDKFMAWMVGMRPPASGSRGGGSYGSLNRGRQVQQQSTAGSTERLGGGGGGGGGGSGNHGGGSYYIRAERVKWQGLDDKGHVVTWFDQPKLYWAPSTTSFKTATSGNSSRRKQQHHGHENQSQSQRQRQRQHHYRDHPQHGRSTNGFHATTVAAADAPRVLPRPPAPPIQLGAAIPVAATAPVGPSVCFPSRPSGSLCASGFQTARERPWSEHQHEYQDCRISNSSNSSKMSRSGGNSMACVSALAPSNDAARHGILFGEILEALGPTTATVAAGEPPVAVYCAEDDHDGDATLDDYYRHNYGKGDACDLNSGNNNKNNNAVWMGVSDSTHMQTTDTEAPALSEYSSSIYSSGYESDDAVGREEIERYWDPDTLV